MKRIRIFILPCVLKATLLFMLALPAHAQLPIEINPKVPYYIDVNQSDKSDVYAVHDNYLSLEYNDKFGLQKQIDLKLYNWKLELVGLFKLDKIFGLNNYNINLKNMAPLEKGFNYLCVLKDESGNDYQWYIKQEAEKKGEISADIFVNPLSLECDEEAGNVVEYYGQISNGRGPYTIRWYIMNDTKTDFLYQPREDKLEDPGKTSMVEVDKAPDYYVMMDVTDACGANAKKMVFIRCQEKKKIINTIFVEPLQGPPTTIQTGN